MFTVVTVHDTIRIPPHLLSLPTHQAVCVEIDAKYVGHVLMDVGLVVSRYTTTNTNMNTTTNGNTASNNNDATNIFIQSAACVAGDAGVHCTTRFQLLVFSPAQHQVCIGRVLQQSAQGLTISVGGFFEDVFVPAYWMLNPSHYEEATGMWIWAPVYDAKDDDDEAEGDDDENDKAVQGGTAAAGGVVIKTEPMAEHGSNGDAHDALDHTATDHTATAAPPARYEMHIGAKIRFRVRSIHYTRVTPSAKAAPVADTLAMTASTNHSGGGSMSSSMQSHTNHQTLSLVGSQSAFAAPPPPQPPAMRIVASICEDGLGLTEWWFSNGEDEEEGNADADDNDNDEAMAQHEVVKEEQDIKPVMNGVR
ncbi:hypothetical protein MPSEU_000553000 [Mayamaea pseudoterrestris]|nr:hypothetical protein MPSEU_000553000 [Mayamaea pseudoterrestris]